MNAGLKIVNNIQYKNINKQILQYFENNPGVLLEIGFYFDPNMLNSYFMQYCYHVKNKVNTHANLHYDMLNLHRFKREFEAEIKLSKLINSDYSIVHLASSQRENKSYPGISLIHAIWDNLCLLDQIAKKEDFVFYIENIYRDVYFYTQLFRELKREGLNNIGFCFDIGHAKVWSRQNLRDWQFFLQELYAMAIPLHVHFHLNNGQEDEHLSFLEFTKIKGDEFSGYMDYRDVYASLEEEYPEVRKIFEVKPKFAIMNLEYITAAMHQELRTMVR